MRINPLRCFALLLINLLMSVCTFAQIEKIYINPKSAGTEKQSKFVDSLKFIVLEAKEGVTTSVYNNVIPTEKYFLIADWPSQTLIIYSDQGKFLKKVSYKKLGNYLYPNYNKYNNEIEFFGKNKNYALTPLDDIKISLDFTNPKNRKYFKKYIIDLKDTSFTIKKAAPNEYNLIGAGRYYKDFYISGKINTSPLYKDSLGHELQIYQNNKVVKSYFPYNRVNEPKYLYSSESIGTAYSDKPYILYVTRPYCDTIYKLSGIDIEPFYQIVLPMENSIPASFYTTYFKNKAEKDNYLRNNGWQLRQIYNYLETEKYITFLISYMSNFESYLYDKQSKNTYKLKNIKPDSTQYNLPLLGEFGLWGSTGKFNKMIQAGELIDFFKNNKSIPVPKELQLFLASKPKRTAPVLVEFQLKK